MCQAAKNEVNFSKPIDFDRSIRNLNVFNSTAGERSYLSPSNNYHYYTGLGRTYDMQYVMTGWALEKQYSGSAMAYYAGYSFLGRGIANLLNGNGYKTNFFDNENGGGLMFGFWGAKRYDSFSTFAKSSCECIGK